MQRKTQVSGKVAEDGWKPGGDVGAKRVASCLSRGESRQWEWGGEKMGW